MTTLRLSRAGGGILEQVTDSIVIFATDVTRSWRRRRAFATACEELRVLTDRELADIGIHRSDITRIAREAALIDLPLR
jgi:uncharacterized protein YjiS (DUF1127 family)